MDLKESIRQEVRTSLYEEKELTESQVKDIQETMINEGFGSAVAKTIGALGAGSIAGNIGGAITGYGSMAVAGIVSALGLISPVAIIPIGVVTGSVGGLYFLYKGAQFGWKGMSNMVDDRLGDAALELTKAVQERDEILKQLEKGDEDKAEKLSSKLDQMTQKQKKASQKLDKELKDSINSGRLKDQEEIRAYKEIIKASKDGKLSYIGDDK